MVVVFTATTVGSVTRGRILRSTTRHLVISCKRVYPHNDRLVEDGGDPVAPLRSTHSDGAGTPLSLIMKRM